MKVTKRVFELINQTKSFHFEKKIGDDLTEEEINAIRFDGKNGYMKGEFDCDNPIDKVNRQYVGRKAWKMCFEMAKKSNIRIFTDDIDGVFSVCEQDLKSLKIRHRKFVRNVPVLAQHDYSCFE